MTSNEYLPYLLLALFMLLIFNVLPFVLLALYPFKCFQRLLSFCCSMRCKLALQIYMDTFHGCYAIEDSTCDNRQFSTLYLAVRFINLLLLSLFHIHLYRSMVLFPFAVTLALVARFKPYKDKRSNTVDIVLLLALILCICSYALLSKYTADSGLLPHHLTKIILILLVLIPPGYFLFLITIQVVPRVLNSKCFTKSKKYLLKRFNGLNVVMDDENENRLLCGRKVANYKSFH